MTNLEFSRSDSLEKKDIFVILPVLNEEENIYPLLNGIRNVLSDQRHTVCIIDDGSSDKTVDIIESAVNEGFSLHLIKRKKTTRGSQRGSALFEGIKWGLAHTTADVFIEIDGDCSHRPEELPLGIELVRSKKADVAIASKYVPGSKTVNRTFGRRGISYLANFFIGFCLDSKINDYSNGYRFYSRKAAEIIAESEITYGSPIYLTEALAIWLKRGMIVKEFPTTYVGRGEGLSKLRWTDIFKAIIGIIEITIRFHISGFSHKSDVSDPDNPKSETSAWSSTAVLCAAVFTILFIIAMNWFTPRSINFDEMGLYNPIYTFLEYGKMTYPIHQWPDSMVVLPPDYFLVTAFFIIMGMSTYYAFGALPIILGIICVIAIVSSPFRPSLRCAALLSIPVTSLFLNITYPGIFQLRPEQSLAFAWFAGLIFLESARLEGWNTRKLFLGAILLTFASVLHYFAAPAVLGLLVYAFVAYRDLGYRSARLKLAPMFFGAAIIMIPHIFLWILPNLKDIVWYTTSNGFQGGILSGIDKHVWLYQFYSSFPRTPLLINLVWPVISLNLLLPLWIWIPFILYKKTRVFAIASIPMMLFVLVVSHKWMIYCIPEFFLFYTFVFGLIFIIIEKGSGILKIKYNIPDVSQKIILILVLVCIFLLWSGTSWSSIMNDTTYNFHEMDLARASTQDIIGNNSLVGGRALHWYTGGGVYWYDLSPDLLWYSKPIPPDINQYFNKFDYIVESQGSSESTLNENHETLGTWYLQDYLSLAGFYFTENHGSSMLVFQSPNHTAKNIMGYVYMPDGTLMQFNQNPYGYYALVNYITTDPNRVNRYPYSILLMPKENKYLEKFSIYNNDTQLYLKSIIIEKEDFASFTNVTPDDTIINIIPGEFHYKNPEKMMANLKQNDKKIEFLGWEYATLKKKSPYSGQAYTKQCSSTGNCILEKTMVSLIKNSTPVLKIIINNRTFYQDFESNCYAGKCYTESVNGTMVYTPKSGSDHIASKYFTLSSNSSGEQTYFSKITFSAKETNRNIFDDGVIMLQNQDYSLVSNNLNDKISEGPNALAFSESTDGNLTIYREFLFSSDEKPVRLLLTGSKDLQYLIPQEISFYQKPV